MTGTATVTAHSLLGMASTLLEITPSLLSMKSLNTFLAASALGASTVASSVTLYFIGVPLSCPFLLGVDRSSADCRVERQVDVNGADGPGRARCSHPQRTFDKYWAAETGLEPD